MNYLNYIRPCYLWLWIFAVGSCLLSDMLLNGLVFMPISGRIVFYGIFLQFICRILLFLLLASMNLLPSSTPPPSSPGGADMGFNWTCPLANAAFCFNYLACLFCWSSISEISENWTVFNRLLSTDPLVPAHLFGLLLDNDYLLFSLLLGRKAVLTFFLGKQLSFSSSRL